MYATTASQTAERTLIRRTNDPRFVIRVVETEHEDGRVTRSSYLVEVGSGSEQDERHERWSANTNDVTVC